MSDIITPAGKFGSYHHAAQHYGHHHGRQNALEGCLALLRGLPGGQEACEATLGHLMAALAHSHHIRGLMQPLARAAASMDHYATEPQARAY